MNGYNFCSCVFASLCYFYRINAIFVPTRADFNRNRYFYRVNYRFYNAFGQLRVFHKSGAAAVSGNFRNGAAEVYIDCVRFIFKSHFCGFSHNFRFASEKLNGAGAFRFVDFEKFGGFFASVGKAF